LRICWRRRSRPHDYERAFFNTEQFSFPSRHRGPASLSTDVPNDANPMIDFAPFLRVRRLWAAITQIREQEMNDSGKAMDAAVKKVHDSEMEDAATANPPSSGDKYGEASERQWRKTSSATGQTRPATLTRRKASEVRIPCVLPGISSCQVAATT
jgi:hypothetical protein